MGVSPFSGLLVALLVSVGFSLWNREQPPVVRPSEDDWWGPGLHRKDNEAIRPFKIAVSDEVLKDLNYRLDHTRALTPPLEGIHFEYGFNTDTLQKILTFWRKEYRWRDREAYLNSIPQFKTEIQGLDIHFLHVKPDLKKAGVKRSVPLLLLHGWPGSVREFYDIIPLLTQKPLHGADFVFEVVVPSLPGFGFSSGAVRPGLGPAQMSIVLSKLMVRLGHQQWYVQGGDWGSQVASHQALFYPERVRGLHLNMCTTMSTLSRLYVLLGSIWPSAIVGEEYASELYPLGEKFGNTLLESGYLHIQATKPDTVGVGVTDSPAGLAAYILEKFSTGTNRDYRSVPDGGLLEKYTYEDLLDNVMLYWVTSTATHSFRIYSEHFAKPHRDLNLDSAKVQVPTWCSQFKNELGILPPWILRTRYPQLRDVRRYNFGGHFAAFEMPKQLADDIWRSFVAAEQERQAKPKQS